MRPLLISMVLVVAVGCGKDAGVRDAVREDDHPQVRIGMDQADVQRILGPPNRKGDMVRQDMPGFGEPSWWRTELAVGDKVEAWEYDTSRGRDTIYFLKGSTKVGHTRFVAKEVVF
jgi:hypothetical protein